MKNKDRHEIRMENGHIVNHTRTRMTKPQLMLIIAGTSLCWLIIDINLLYFFKYENKQSEDLEHGMKMPRFEMTDQIIKASDNESIKKENNIMMNKNYIVNDTNESSNKSNESFGDIVKQDNLYQQIRNIDVTTFPRNLSAPGENGEPARYSPEEQQLVDIGYAKHKFNQYVSDKVSVERSIPDPRPPECGTKQYPYSLLLKTSVIICYTNESWSVLLRTVHSVLNRSPPELLEEVILVDDFSQQGDQKQALHDYFRKFPKVKIIHLPERQGLIRARVQGVMVAKGPVLTFLDSHVECCIGWLEPMLERIRLDNRTVVSPIIDSIDADNIQYNWQRGLFIGVFNWLLEFNWSNLPAHEMDRIKGDNTMAVRTPAIAGGLFSIHKQFFHDIGYYDPGLEIWGGEHIELALKTWMCGGKMEIHPCSHVGHIFRSKNPYTYLHDVGETIRKNTQRVAEAWLDEYKDIFYLMMPAQKEVDFGDVSSRIQLKEQMKCHNFSWFLTNVFPELKVPSSKNLVAYGMITNLAFYRCMDTYGDRLPVGLYPCNWKDSRNQIFRYSIDGKLENLDKCVSHVDKELYNRQSCDSINVLNITHEQESVIRDVTSDLCLDAEAKNSKLILAPCDPDKLSQKWRFKEYYT